MYKNWLVLGDEAFTANSTPIGGITIAKGEVSKWREIAIKKLESRPDCPKLKEFIVDNPYLYILATFPAKAGVTNEDLQEFFHEATAILGCKPGFFSLDVAKSNCDGYLWLDFTSIAADVQSEVEINHTSYGDVHLHMLNGGWLHCDYQDIRLNNKEGTYFVDFNGRKFILQWNHPDLGIRRMTKLIKHHFVYLQQMDDGHVSIVSNEDVVKETLMVYMGREDMSLSYIFYCLRNIHQAEDYLDYIPSEILTPMYEKLKKEEEEE